MIPEKADQAANRKKRGSKGGRPVGHDAALYTERNTVERCINRLRNWRSIATRYDKTPQSYEAGLHLCGAHALAPKHRAATVIRTPDRT